MLVSRKMERRGVQEEKERVGKSASRERDSREGERVDQERVEKKCK